MRGVKSVTFNNVSFLGNGQTNQGIGDLGKPVVLLCLQELVLINSSFINNSGTPLRAVNSKFTVVGDIYFINNTATEGAAIYFYGASRVVLHNTTTIYFTNNHALATGGAVQISDNNLNPPFSDPVCFISAGEGSEARLVFTNNTAENGGDAIYGGSLDQARESNSNISCIQLTQFHSNFSFPQHNHERYALSLIASTPSRVCLCDNIQLQCLNFSMYVDVYPGETIEIHAFTVGQHFGTAQGTVYGQFFNTNTSVPLTTLQKSQKVTSQYSCESNKLKYTMKTLQTKVQNILVLTATVVSVSDYYDIEAIEKAREAYYESGNTTVPLELLIIPVFVIVHFERCPPGFKLENGSCECIEQLHKLSSRFDVKCTIGRVPTIQREQTLWVDDIAQLFSYSEYCLATHCNFSKVEVKQNSSDKQCINNRRGRLCGRCKGGYSLAIGSSRCLSQCSDLYLLLLAVFAVLGVLLVGLVKYLDLTVSQGALNGLIFYANIIQTSNNAFLSQKGVSGMLLSVIIAWINLDFGIETCFSSDLDMYTKTWLQFMFPLYIWILVLGIILVCRYSEKATRFFGTNTVQVLCTLFLLSYNKLLRTITVVFSLGSVVHIPDDNISTTDIVWAYDGDFKSKHIALLFVSGGFFLFLWLPFTTFLLLGPWLQRFNHRRGLRWVGRMTPLLDAFYSPFKARRRYWVGVLLLARVMVLVPAATPSANTSASVLTVALLSTTLLFYTSSVGGVYKKKYLALLEDSFLVNLIMFSALAAYSDSAKQIAGYFSFIHVALALVAIIAVQIYRKIGGKGCKQECVVCGEDWLRETDGAADNHRDGYSDLDQDDPTVYIQGN